MTVYFDEWFWVLVLIVFANRCGRAVNEESACDVSCLRTQRYRRLSLSFLISNSPHRRVILETQYTYLTGTNESWTDN